MDRQGKPEDSVCSHALWSFGYKLHIKQNTKGKRLQKKRKREKNGQN